MELSKQEQIDKRRARRDELDRALANGVLTLADILAIPPTETSPEHHRTLVRALSAVARKNSL